MRARAFGQAGIAFGLLFWLAAAAPAQEGDVATEGGVCRPPISLCRPLPVIGGAESLTSSVAPFPFFHCPPGSTCTCVPSCPGCLDCPVQVCVPGGPVECRSACDCPAGIGCFEGRCVPGFAPVFCCESYRCPAGEACQHPDGTNDRCPRSCVDEVWACDLTSDTTPCGADRVCTCTTTCPFCEVGPADRPEICGPPVCVPKGVAPPQLCTSSDECRGRGERCACVSSGQGLDDCPFQVCVRPCDGPTCAERRESAAKYIARIVRRAGTCHEHSECVKVDTGTGCMGTCGAWVNERHLRRVEKFIDRVDHRFCSDYQADGCPFITPGCLFERGVCVDGHCRGVGVLQIPVTDPELTSVLEISPDQLLDLAPNP